MFVGRVGCTAGAEHQRQWWRHIYVVYGPPHGWYAWFAMLAMFGAPAAEVWALLFSSNDFNPFLPTCHKTFWQKKEIFPPTPSYKTPIITYIFQTTLSSLSRTSTFSPQTLGLIPYLPTMSDGIKQEHTWFEFRTFSGRFWHLRCGIHCTIWRQPSGVC